MKDFRSILILLLAVMLLAILGFYIYDKSQTTTQAKQTINADSTAFKKAVQQAVEDSLKKLQPASRPDTIFISKDSVQQKNVEDSTNKNMNRESAIVEDIKKPRIPRSSMYFEATGINLAAINEGAGNKPEVTSIAKDAEKFILSFVLHNKTLPTSGYTIYIVITKPNQKVLRKEGANNDYFLAGKEGLKLYTQRIHFTYIRKSKKTLTCIVNHESFSPGVYTVKIYHNGKMIGMGSKQLQ